MTFAHSPLPFARAASAIALIAAALSGCSSIDNMLSGDKIDYKSTGAKTPGLDVPPDLSQLARDSRYQTSGSTVSASALQTPAPPAAAATATVAPQAVGGLRIERSGTSRWLASNATPEQLWPQIEAFWKESGFVVIQSQANIGLMETDWAENRAKLPQDFIRRTVGRVLDSLYSTSERDKFRTRLERGANGTEIYITHRGMVEVYSGGGTTTERTTSWQPRAADPELEAEMLARLMIKLGAKDEQARTAVAAATAAPTAAARARVIEGQAAATLQVDEPFDRAWRRVGLALDRSGFTVEDRDRAQGLYYVRYVDPAMAGKEEPGFFGKLFGKKSSGGPVRYRVSVKGETGQSVVTVQNAQGAPENGEAGTRIVRLLVDDLK